MTKKPDTYSYEETERRRDQALGRALNTPPKPHDEMKLGKEKKRKPNASASKKT